MLMIVLLGVTTVLPQKVKYFEPKLVPPIGHTNSIAALAYSPNGKVIASGSEDSNIILWDVETGREVKTLIGHTHLVNSLVYSIDGRTIISGSWDGTIKFWDAKTGTELNTLMGHSSRVYCLAISPDGRTLASGSADSTIKIWNIETGRVITSLFGHTDAINAISFSPDGTTLVSGSDDSVIKIWDVKRGNETKSISGNNNSILTISYSPDGSTFATGSKDSTITLWDSKTGTMVKRLRGHDDYVLSVAFVSGGKTLVSGSADKTIKLWDVATGNEIRTLTGHREWVYSLSISPDGQTIASGSFDNFLKLWDVQTGNEIKTFSGHSSGVISLAYSPDGRTLASGSRDISTLNNLIKLWYVEEGKEAGTLKGHSSWIFTIDYSPDGRFIASGSRDSTIIIWDVASGNEIKRMEGGSDWVYSVTYSPDGQTLASAYADSTIILWDVKTGNELRRLLGHSGGVPSIVYNPDGTTLASCSEDSTIILWDANTGNVRKVLKGHSAIIVGLAYSPDGTMLASSSLDSTIILWNVATGEEVKTLKGHSDGVFSVAFSPDGSVLASGSFDDNVLLWDVTTGEKIHTLSGHTYDVEVVVFSPDGTTLASGSDDNTTKLWDVKTGLEKISMIAIDSTDWMVIAPNGLFDASQKAMEFLHFVADNEVIELLQLKDRYYEPGLLSKLLGYSKDPIRSVPDFNKIRLTPDVTLKKSPDNRTLDVTLTNRGGGIGTVQLFVNNKEIIADLRKSPSDSSKQSLKISVNLYDKALLPHYYYDTLNTVEIKVWNAEHYIISRGDTIQFQPQVAIAKGLGVKQDDMGSKASSDLRFYGVFVGVSNYSGSNIDLQFAGKDAEDIGKAMELGANELFGKEKVHVAILSTEGTVENALPRKKQIKEALEKLKGSRPQDVVVVYLSGHGASFDDEFYFLTMDAKAISNDPYMKEQSLSSKELTDLLNQIPAKKKLVIYDACHSGKGAELLALGVKSVPSSVIRSIEKMKDRSGMLILSGSAADQSSYELGVFGQGVLTRSLLEAITQETLRKEGSDNFIDAVALVTKGKEKTEAYATQYNLKQEPKVYGLEKTSGFDLGRVTPAVIKSIELPNPRPLFMESALVDRTKLRDVIKLSAAVNEYLTEQSANSRGAVGFTDLSESPIAYQIAGGYTVEGNTITVEIEVLKDNNPINSTPIKITGEVNNKPALAEKIVTAALKITGK